MAVNCNCNVPHHGGRHGFVYYVSVVRGARRRLLDGPWPTHREALARVERVRRRANEMDPRSHFDGFGTASAPEDGAQPGLLQHLGIAA